MASAHELGLLLGSTKSAYALPQQSMVGAGARLRKRPGARGPWAGYDGTRNGETWQDRIRRKYPNLERMPNPGTSRTRPRRAVPIMDPRMRGAGPGVIGKEWSTQSTVG